MYDQLRIGTKVVHRNAQTGAVVHDAVVCGMEKGDDGDAILIEWGKHYPCVTRHLVINYNPETGKMINPNLGSVDFEVDKEWYWEEEPYEISATHMDVEAETSDYSCVLEGFIQSHCKPSDFKEFVKNYTKQKEEE